MDFYAAGTEVIAEGQRALPALRHAGAFEGLQNRRGIVVADGNGDDVRLIAVWAGEILMRAESGRSSVEATPGVSGSPGYLKRYCTEPRCTPVSGRHGPFGLRIAFVVAVVLRVRVDENADGAALLGEIDFDAAKVGAVAADDDFAVQIDVLRGEFVEVFKAAVVGVDDFAGDVARSRGAVEGHDDAGIVLARIAVDVLARGAAHEQMAGCVPGLDADDFGLFSSTR